MSNPNLLSITSAYGKTVAFSITTLPSVALFNADGSNKVFKINSIFIANTHGTADSAVTIEFFRSGVAYKIASTINVAADSSLVALGKDTGIYLEEGDAIRVSATDDEFLTGVISYDAMG